MKVRVKKGKKGFIYGKLWKRDEEGKGRDEFTLKPVEHSTEADSNGDPVVISVESQFSNVWMESLEPKEKPAEPKKPADMRIDHIKKALKAAEIEFADDAEKPDLVKLLEDHLSK